MTEPLTDEDRKEILHQAKKPYSSVDEKYLRDWLLGALATTDARDKQIREHDCGYALTKALAIAENRGEEIEALEWLVEGYRQRLTEAKERKVVLDGMTQEQKDAVFFIKACVADALRFTVADYPGGEADE